MDHSVATAEHVGSVILPIVIALVVLIFLSRFFLKLIGIIVVPQDSIGIIVKKFAVRGATRLPEGHIIALHGEPGMQADTLPPGLYFRYWSWQYSVKFVKFTNVPQGQMGVVEANDGAPLPMGAVLAHAVDCNSFQNAKDFLTNGGQRGPQVAFLTPGSWRINTDLFSVKLENAVQIPEDQVGVVTTYEGKPLDTGEIAGGIIPGHNRFQDGQTFIINGGYKGLQEEVMQAGTYYLNPLFVHVDMHPLIKVPIGSVGVVVSYVGESDLVPDATLAADEGPKPGEASKHGRIVQRGKKGVWREPLDPGKYPINPRTHFVEIVPTTNIVLNWADGKTEAHNLDANLSTIKVQSLDGFSFNLDVSQIIHVPRDRASAVIARFGNMPNLVSQVLQPVVGNYFRNSAQSHDAIDFLQGRKDRQEEARTVIMAAINTHDVEAVDTLIGDIDPPQELMDTLTQQKIAERQVKTFEAQQTAAEAEQKLNKAAAEAETSGQVVTAERSVQVARLQADAAIESARGQAEAKKTNAEADAFVQLTVGEATAKRTLAIGEAEAKVQQLKVESVGNKAYALIEVSNALAKNHTKLVPDVLVMGGEGGSDGKGLLDVIVGSMVRDKFTSSTAATTPASDAPALEAAPAAEETAS